MKKKSKKNKGIGRLSLLLFGILIGVFVGGSSMWWFSYKDVTFHFSDKLKKIFYSNFSFKDDDTLKMNVNELKSNKKNKKNKRKNGQREKLSMQDSLLFNDPAYGEYYEQMGGNIDTLISDSSTYNYNKEDFVENERPISYTEIVVQKDKLSFSKSVVIKESDREGKNKSTILDSVLLHNKPSKKVNKSAILVEFWASPVNFKGYKMSRNKIVIYGLAYDENLKIEKNAGLFYLKNFDSYYLLEYTDSFKPLLLVQAPK